jgi:hypothetical protein
MLARQRPSLQAFPGVDYSERNAVGIFQQLEAATDQAIAACGGDVRAALKAMILANEQLQASVSNGYACGSRPRAIAG